MSKDKVVTTLLEHHSNFLLWLRLKSFRVVLDIVKPDKNGVFNVPDFEWDDDAHRTREDLLLQVLLARCT